MIKKKANKYKVGDKVIAKIYTGENKMYGYCRAKMISLPKGKYNGKACLEVEGPAGNYLSLVHLHNIWTPKEVLYYNSLWDVAGSGNQGLIIIKEIDSQSFKNREELKLFKALAEKFGYELEG